MILFLTGLIPVEDVLDLTTGMKQAGKQQQV
jgi:hypothetical protein